MTTKLKGLAITAMLATISAGAMAQEPLEIVFTHHSSASNTFWQAVQKGFDDACGKIAANCQMIFTQTEGAVQEQLANMEAALARQPDAILTSIVDNTALDEIIQRARDAGVIVIGVNVDREQADAQRFLNDVPARFDIFYDVQGKLATKYEVPGMPSSYVFGPDGKLVNKHIGFRNASRAEREVELRKLLSLTSR